MFRTIVSANCPVTLVGAGHIGNQDLTYASEVAPRLVAADGGARFILRSGRIPEAVIGDFDSLSDHEKVQIPKSSLHHISEQNTTDFEKSLCCIDAPVVVAIGFLGHRLDHSLAVLSALAAHSSKRCIALGEEEIVFHLPPAIDLPLEPGERVSLFPMREVSGRSTGLKWPIDGIDFAPGGRIGTSNEATGAVRIETDGPGLLALLLRKRLALVTQLLAKV
jgi:thiamine pyrophosphokinase